MSQCTLLRALLCGSPSGCVCLYMVIVAMLYPFSQFCEIDSFLLSLQKEPKTAANLFQRGIEYGKYRGSCAQALRAFISEAGLYKDLIRHRLNGYSDMRLFRFGPFGVLLKTTHIQKHLKHVYDNVCMHVHTTYVRTYVRTYVG